MKKIAGIIIVGIAMFPSGIAFADHEYEGNGNNDQRRCQGDNCRGSFSPGPFDRSPVDIHDNYICISPDCSGRGEEKK